MRRLADSSPTHKSRLGPNPVLPSLIVGFFPLCFAYVWLRLEPEVIWTTTCPVFFLSRPFFRPFLACPGGLLDYAAAFLAQLNASNGLGSLVFTALCLAVFMLTCRVLQSIRVGVPSIP